MLQYCSMRPLAFNTQAKSRKGLGTVNETLLERNGFGTLEAAFPVAHTLWRSIAGLRRTAFTGSPRYMVLAVDHYSQAAIRPLGFTLWMMSVERR